MFTLVVIVDAMYGLIRPGIVAIVLEN